MSPCSAHSFKVRPYKSYIFQTSMMRARLLSQIFIFIIFFSDKPYIFSKPVLCEGLSICPRLHTLQTIIFSKTSTLASVASTVPSVASTVPCVASTIRVASTIYSVESSISSIASTIPSDNKSCGVFSCRLQRNRVRNDDTTSILLGVCALARDKQKQAPSLGIQV